MKRAVCAVALFFVVAIAGCRDAGGAGEDDPARHGAPPLAVEPDGDEIAAAECVTFVPPDAQRPTPSGDASTDPRVREVGLLPSEVSLVAVGDSLTFGQASTHPGGDTSYPAVLGRLLGSPAVNRGVPSHGTKDLPDVDYLLVPGKQNRLVVMIGGNDIHGDLHASAAETYARLKSYVAAREQSGWLVTVNTPPRWLTATGASDQTAIEYEAMIRTGFSHVADVAASPLIGRGAPSGPDLAYYGDELGHLNDAGYAALARIVKDSWAPKGSDPNITPSMSIARSASLTAWFRDWVQGTTVPLQMERPAKWLNIADGVDFVGSFDAYGRDRPTRVLDAINGRPALRFNGPGSGFYVPMYRLTGHLIRSRELVISVVMKVENITSAALYPYDNDGIFSDAGTRLGMTVKQPSTVVAFTYDGANWTNREGAIPLGAPVVVSMRLLKGKLGLRVGTRGEWSEIPAANIDKLTNAFHIGTDSTTSKTFSGLIADLVIRRSYCEPTMAADDAYFRARYGVQ